MRVLIAFDKFKDSLSAAEACRVAADTLQAVHPEWQVDLCPIADGGEGMAETLTVAIGGRLRRAPVRGPRGGVVNASFGLVDWQRIPESARRRLDLPELEKSGDGTLAVVEMATASGLALLNVDQRDPWMTTTHGTGELLLRAAASGADAILLGVGGSATNDLGVGALAALGVRFLDSSGESVTDLSPRNWKSIVRVDNSALAPLPPIRIACDVVNPLLGAKGCTAIYGRQKGLKGEDMDAMEYAVERMALLLGESLGAPPSLKAKPGMGAAGGITFGLSLCTDARLMPGSALVTDWLDLEKRLSAADIVLTGEGCFDEGSLMGKGPGHLALQASRTGKIAFVFAGQIRTTSESKISLKAITPPGMPLAKALPRTAEFLRNHVADVFRL